MIDPRRVLVVIPMLNEARAIAGCLDSLMTGDPALAQVRFVAADGGSTDGTQAIVAGLAQTRPNLRLIDNPGRLQAAAVNLAAREHAGGADILVRCDAHALYPPRFVLDLAERLVALGVDSVAAPMDSVGETPLQRAIGWASDTPLGNGGAAHRGGRRSGLVDHGHHAAFRLDRFLALGGYDERFAANEDAEYDLRLTRAGGRIWLAGDLRLVYRPRASLGALWRQYRRYGAGRAQTARKHRARLRLRQIAPAANLLAQGAALAAAPFAPATLVLPGLYLGALAAAGAVIAAARRAPEGLLAAPALLTMHTAWAVGFLGGLARSG